MECIIGSLKLQWKHSAAAASSAILRRYYTPRPDDELSHAERDEEEKQEERKRGVRSSNRSTYSSIWLYGPNRTQFPVTRRPLLFVLFFLLLLVADSTVSGVSASSTDAW